MDFLDDCKTQIILRRITSHFSAGTYILYFFTFIQKKYSPEQEHLMKTLEVIPENLPKL
jgi:hypothetical protein